MSCARITVAVVAKLNVSDTVRDIVARSFSVHANRYPDPDYGCTAQPCA